MHISCFLKMQHRLTFSLAKIHVALLGNNFHAALSKNSFCIAISILSNTYNCRKDTYQTRSKSICIEIQLRNHRYDWWSNRIVRWQWNIWWSNNGSTSVQWILPGCDRSISFAFIPLRKKKKIMFLVIWDIQIAVLMLMCYFTKITGNGRSRWGTCNDISP